MAATCTTCTHPHREAIDQALLSRSASIRSIANQYGLTHTALLRHEDEHLPHALVVYEQERRTNSLIETAEVFHTNVKRLRLAQDAVHEWLTDPENPEKYDIGARAEEVTVTYLDVDENGKPTKKRAKMHVILEGLQRRHGILVTGFETKFADPRKLLTDYSNALAGEIQLFLNAWEAWQEQQRRDKEATAAQEDAGAILEEIVIRKLAGPLGEATARKILDLLLAEEE